MPFEDTHIDTDEYSFQLAIISDLMDKYPDSHVISLVIVMWTFRETDLIPLYWLIFVKITVSCIPSNIQVVRLITLITLI